MTTAMPALETRRLIIRPLRLDDLDAVHQMLDIELAEEATREDPAAGRAARADWLRWTVMNYEQLAKLYQPPYGERGIELRDGSELGGVVGFVQSLGPWEQLPGLAAGTPLPNRRFTPAFGMYWAVRPALQRRGYASEAASAMIHYAFDQLNMRRVVATTEHDNLASQAVMRRVGMRVERNPFPDPPWFQVVGVIDHDEP